MYIFNHIPKCGGVSYLKLFQSIYGADNVVHLSLNENVDYAIQPSAYKKKYVVMGHFGITWHSLLAPGYRWLTAVREPVDRVLSTYFFWRYNAPASPNLPHVHLAQTLALDEFVRSDHYLVHQGISNAQTWQLADDLRVRYRHISEKDALETAKTNLQRFDFIGIYEDFARSISRLCDYLHVAVPSDVPHENRTSFREPLNCIAPATIQKIRELNAADSELYEFAQSCQRHIAQASSATECSRGL